MERAASETVSGWWYLLGGAALGVALGLLAAPRALADDRRPARKIAPRRDAVETR